MTRLTSLGIASAALVAFLLAPMFRIHRMHAGADVGTTAFLALAMFVVPALPFLMVVRSESRNRPDTVMRLSMAQGLASGTRLVLIALLCAPLAAMLTMLAGFGGWAALFYITAPFTYVLMPAGSMFKPATSGGGWLLVIALVACQFAIVRETSARLTLLAVEPSRRSRWQTGRAIGIVIAIAIFAVVSATVAARVKQ